MCQLYCPGRGHSVRWFELSVKALPQRAMNMCLPQVVWGIPRNWGCCSNPARCTKVSMTQNLSKNTTQKNFQKINIKAPHQLHQTHVLVWIFPWSKVQDFGEENPGLNLRYYRQHLLSSFEIYGEKDFLITPTPLKQRTTPLKGGVIIFSMTLPNIFAIQFVLSLTRHFITLDTAISKSSCVTCWRRSRKANIPAWAPRYGATLKESWIVCMIKSWPVQVRNMIGNDTGIEWCEEVSEAFGKNLSSWSIVTHMCI